MSRRCIIYIRVLSSLFKLIEMCRNVVKMNTFASKLNANGRSIQILWMCFILIYTNYKHNGYNFQSIYTLSRVNSNTNFLFNKTVECVGDCIRVENKSKPNDSNDERWKVFFGLSRMYFSVTQTSFVQHIPCHII